MRRRLNQIAAAKRRLLGLRETILDIYEALQSVQEETLSGNLASLMPAVQAFFTEMGGHPEYSRLEVEPEADAKTVDQRVPNPRFNRRRLARRLR